MGGDYAPRHVVDGALAAVRHFDLGHLMREQFYLSLPMKALCSDGCRGLCVVCGTNLNSGACGCTRTWEDPRLAPLRDLRKPELSNDN